MGCTSWVDQLGLFGRGGVRVGRKYGLICCELCMVVAVVGVCCVALMGLIGFNINMDC